MVKKIAASKKITKKKKPITKKVATPVKKAKQQKEIIHTKFLIIFLIISAIIGLTATILFINPAIALKVNSSNNNVLSAESLNE